MLSFENQNDRTLHSNFYLRKGEIKDCNVMINGKNLSDQAINSDLKTYENIRITSTGQGDDYLTLLDYPYLKDY